MDDWSSTVSSAKVSKPHHGDILSYRDRGGACDKPWIGHVDLTVLSICQKAVTFDHNLTLFT